MRTECQLNRKEEAIFNALRLDSRRKLQEISKCTNIPVSTAYDILNKLKERIICRFTIIPRFECIGFNTRAVMIIWPEKNRKDIIKKRICCMCQVNNMVFIDGCAFLIELIARDNQELNSIVDRFESDSDIRDFKVHIILEDIKREDFIVR